MRLPQHNTSRGGLSRRWTWGQCWCPSSWPWSAYPVDSREALAGGDAAYDDGVYISSNKRMQWVQRRLRNAKHSKNSQSKKNEGDKDENERNVSGSFESPKKIKARNNIWSRYCDFMTEHTKTNAPAECFLLFSEQHRLGTIYFQKRCRWSHQAQSLDNRSPLIMQNEKV
jgi:hypothetical protein